MNWRPFANWAKTSPITLQIADRLGRSKGRTRILDNLNPPPPAPLKPNLANWHNHDLNAIWIGHATTLLRIANLTILTDPVFSNRVGLGLGLFTLGPRRQYAPALSIKQLPHLDLILISHAHFDHLDRPSLNRLPKSTPVITSLHNSDLIRDLGFKNVAELRWQESTTIQNLKITALPANHWGARTFFDRHRGFNSFLLQSPTHRILYGGDTAYHDHFKSISKVDLAILGIGAYDPYVRAHATPEQALDMANHLQADQILPMHHNTFRLSHEPANEPLQRILAASKNNPARIRITQIGGQLLP